MKRWTTASVAFLFLAALAIPAVGQPPTGVDKKEERVINATGTATIKVKPDAVRFSFGVLTGTATVKETRVENVKAGKKVMDALNELKIPNLEFKMTQGEMKMVKQMNGGQLGGGGVIGGGGELMPTISGYRATTSFTVVHKDNNPDKLRETAIKILDAALDAGVNADANGTTNDNWQFGIGGMNANATPVVEFYRQDMVEAQRNALNKAVEDALVNAKAIAGGAKVTIADTIAISDAAMPSGTTDVNSWLSLIYGGGGNTNQAPATTFAVKQNSDGEIEITCKITVKCRY